MDENSKISAFIWLGRGGQKSTQIQKIRRLTSAVTIMALD